MVVAGTKLVEQQTNYPKFEGLNTATATASTWKNSKKIVKK